MTDKEMADRLAQETPERWNEIKPDPEFLARLRRLEDREGRPLIPPGEKPGRPGFWQRFRVGARLELVAAVVVLVAIGVVLASRNLPGHTVQPAGPGPTTPVDVGEPPVQGDPSIDPNVYCNKPADDSGVIVHLYKGESDSDYAVRPGWSVPLPAKYFNVGVVFPRPADLSGITVKVTGDSWKITHPEMTNPPEGMYHFGVWPEGQMMPGKPGWLTVTIDGARDKEGKPYSRAPLTVRVFAVGLNDPQSPSPDALACPGLEIAPSGGNH